MSPPSAAKIGRLLTTLVYRDAARSYGIALAIVVVPAAYLYREWPPWLVRAKLWDQELATRGWLVALAVLGYDLATRALIGQVLASRRLAYWRHLPISRAQWWGLHIRHLVALNLPAVGALAYLLWPAFARDRGSGVAMMVAALALVLAVQVLSASLLDRNGPTRAVAGLVAPTLAGAITSLGAPRVAGLLGIAALVAAGWRLRRALPEPRLQTRSWATGTTPRAALIALGLLTLGRRSRVFVIIALATLLATAGLTRLGALHLGHTEPDMARRLATVLVTIAAWVWALGVISVQRHLDRDRWYLDSLGVHPSDELWARLGLGAAVAVLAVPLFGAALAPVSVAIGAGAAALACIWAAAAATWVGARAEANLRLHASAVVPLLAHLVTVAIAVSLIGSWAWIVATGVCVGLGRRSLVRAARARRRFETTRKDDDHGG